MVPALQRFAFCLRPHITLTGEAVVCETTAFASQGGKSNAKRIGREQRVIRVVGVCVPCT